MPLSTLRRQQLDGIVQKMANQNAPKEAVQSVVNDFKSKYENEEQPKSDGILKSIAKNVASPFLKVGTAAYNVGSSIGKLAQGDVQGADVALNKPRNIPFFGKTEPLVNSSDVNKPGMSGYLPPIKKPVGAALQIASTIIPVGKIGSGIKGVLGSAVKFGTASAAGDVGSQIESGKIFNPVEAAASFGLGAIIPIAIGGTRGILGGVKNRIIGKTAGDVLNKELQVPTSELSSNIEKGIKSFGDKAAEITDKKGNPLYVGNYNTLLNKAKTDLVESGTKLNKTLAQLDKTDNIKISNNQVASDVVSQLQDIYGKLTPSQLKQVQFEVSRMPKIMNRQELLKTKRLYDSLIPDNFWTNTDQNAGFVTQVKYLLRDNARKVLNDVTPDAGLQQLNNRLSVAMDMRKLSASQIASRIKQKNPLSITNAISRLIDDTILNPAITTRLGQAGAYAKNAIPQSIQNISSALSNQIPSSIKNTVTLPNAIRQSFNQNNQ
jgi:hypothetical protein